MRNLLITTVFVGVLLAPAFVSATTVHYVVYPEVKKQTVLGFGVEIQSDSIGSGNNGLPEQALGVPNDLDPSERDRLAYDMLRGFRYLRLAGGLYWRGLDAEQKRLKPRWPEQLTQLKDLVDKSGIEGVSFEYWSVTPYWKANRSYFGRTSHDPDNTLRPFGSNFESDADYRGDRARFFDDFSDAVVDDIKTLERAGIRVSMFGLQNEPFASNDYYSTTYYKNSDEYLAAFKPVASKVRRYDPPIMILADTATDFPSYVAPGMSDPEVAGLVDAYVVHTIGAPASKVKTVDARIRALPVQKPWFQNEYEYLTGGATPDRTLNTVGHIIASFQDAGNPTWFWLHALKPAGNAEASGYALGFWNSRLSPTKAVDPDLYLRWDKGPAIQGVPAGWANWEMVCTKANTTKGYTFITHAATRVHLLIDGAVPEGWHLGTETAEWIDGSGQRHVDRTAHRDFPAGDVEIPANPGGAPHAAFVEPLAGDPHVMIGINVPVYVRSQTRSILKLTQNLAPGHWTYNPLNWNAVGSFVQHMPWDSVVLNATTPDATDATRLLVFQKPNGKRTIVVSNADGSPANFEVRTGISKARWSVVQFTPHDGGNTVGQIDASGDGVITRVVSGMAWEFWEEQ